MKVFLAVVFSLALSTTFFAQDISREQKFQQIKDLNARVNRLAHELLQPDPADLKDAESQDLKAFRLMPREIFSRPITEPSEGGSFYSFTTGSHDYQKIAQIMLEHNNLGIGFAGYNYGFIADLKNIGFSEVRPEIPEYDFLLKYTAPKNIVDARKEQGKAYDYKVDGFTLKSRFPAVVGHTHLLRAISYEKADILVAFKIIRKDADGSLIIYWKQLADFGKPTLDPNIKEK